MTYAVHSPAGAQPIENTETAAKHVLGARASATSPTYGEGQFIYLLGVASTVVGSMVVFNATTYQTALSPNTAGIGSSFAWAMSANVEGQFGWYQLSGLVVAKKTAVKVLAQVAIYQSATTGRVMATVASQKQITGARSANLTTVTATSSTVVLQVNQAHNTGIVI